MVGLVTVLRGRICKLARESADTLPPYAITKIVSRMMSRYLFKQISFRVRIVRILHFHEEKRRFLRI
jgi:hypothetical protein